MADQDSSQPSGPVLFAGARRDWFKLSIFTLATIGYWLLVYLTLSLAETKLPLYQIVSRSLAITGFTYIGWSLFSSLVFKWFPKTAPLWILRRALGVAGFLFGSSHAGIVVVYYYQGRLDTIFYSFNSLLNPLIFGLLAYPILLVMFLTASDWAVAKLGGGRWKRIHQLVYWAYFFLVFHGLLLGSDLTRHWPGIMLWVTTAATLLGQLYWFLVISIKRKFKNLGFLIGVVIIGLYLATAWLAFGHR